MTHKLLKQGIVCSLPLPVTAERKIPFFTLYRYNPIEKRHIRVSLSQYYSERLAFKVFSEQIVKEPLSLSIRHCFITKDKAGKHRGVSYNSFRDSPMRERRGK
jgi:hypothetical protein